MKQSMNIAIRLALLMLTGLMAACSSVKDLTNVDLTSIKVWPFGSSSEAPRVYQPANSTPYICEGNKKFFVRVLDNGASVWLIMPDREVLLTQSGTPKVYSNGISKLNLTGDDVTLEVNETTKYIACKASTAAKVVNVEPKVEKSAAKTEPALAAKTEVPLRPTALAKSEPQQPSQKSWFDKLKFWESDEQPKPVQSVPKTIATEPIKVLDPVVPVKQETAPPVVLETKAEQQKPVTPVIKADQELSGAGLQEMIQEVAQQEAQLEQVVSVKVDNELPGYQKAVISTLDSWANAWRTKNTNVYLSFYSAKFKPEGMSQKAWIEQRKQRLGANTAQITLVLDKVNVVADAEKAEVTFVQHYASGKISDTVGKVLRFENENGHWFIVKEIAQSKK